MVSERFAANCMVFKRFTPGMTLFMRWVSKSVPVGRCMAGTVETRIPGHKMFESGDRQE